MKLVHTIFLRYMIPLFFISLFFFVIMIEIVDLFANIVNYQRLEIPIVQILGVQLLYLPKAISYSLPIALLFATSVSISMLYANNELITILASGMPLYTFTVPVIIIGIFFSIFVFFFDEVYVIKTFREKSELTKTLLRSGQSYNNSNVAVRSKDGNVVYYVDYYNDQEKTFSDLTLFEFDENDRLLHRIDAQSADWDKDKKYWIMRNVSIYVLTPDNSITRSQRAVFEDKKYNISPATFQYKEWKIDELTLPEAREVLINLRNTGREYRQELTDYYTRFSFAITPIIVVLISCSMAGLFKKNVILMTLLLSLCIAVVYYVLRSMTTIMASNGILTPFVGAWLASLVFLAVSIVLYKRAPT